jgi:hypothetical protein
MNMSVALGKFVKGLEELKKEVKVPNVEEAKQEALKEIENSPDYDKRILSIIIEKTMGKSLSDDISKIQTFFDSSTNKPVETIDKLIAEINHGRELLQHQYTPVAPLEPQTKSQESSAVAIFPEDVDFRSLRIELGKMTYNIISELRESGAKEFGYKEVYDRLPEDIRKVFRPESFDTSSGIFNGFKKALGKKEIRRISKACSGKIAKYEVIEAQAAKEAEIIEEHPQTEKTETSVEKPTEAGKRNYYKINKEVLGIIGGFDSKENFSPKKVFDSLSERTKKHYEGKEEYLEKKVSDSFSKAAKKGIIEKLGYRTYKKIAKSKEPQTDYIFTIEKIEKGREITTEDIYESLPFKFKIRYPSLSEQKAISALFYLVERAKEEDLIEETGKRRGSRKLYRRV